MSVCLSELGGPGGGRYARGMNQIGAVVPGAAIVTVGDPDGLAITKAGSGGKTHDEGGCELG
jgi:hypothetical protein